MRRLILASLLATVALPALAALKPGERAPEFSAPAFLAGKPMDFRLADALKRGPVVVYFFPAANTPGCNVEAHLFSEAVAKFAARNTTVIGVTAGNIDQLEAFSKNTETCGGKFAVAADAGAVIAKRYDALLAQKPEWSNRTSYLIDRDGRIAAVHSDPSPKDHVNTMLDAAAKLKPAVKPATRGASPKPSLKQAARSSH